MKKERIKIIVVFALLTIVLSIPTSVGLIKGTDYDLPFPHFSEQVDQKGNYQGFLKVCIVEPTSRWEDHDGNHYHYGFLEYLINKSITIDYNQTTIISEKFTISNLSFNDIQRDNVMFIASVHNKKYHKKYAYPPAQNPFNAYYVDASSACFPNKIGYNTKNETFTHTVFIEEGTANWCHNCPPTSEAINKIFNSYDYPFYFTSMVSDKNQNAKSRLDIDYNILGYPTFFFDGGNTVIVGNKENIEEEFKSAIENCGKRDVHDLNLTISSTWQDNGEFSITISVTNEELVRPDYYNPNISIEKPLNGIYINDEFKTTFPTTFIFGKINVIVNATDNNSGIQNVKIYVKDELKVTLNPNENQWMWDEVSFGRYKLTIVAIDNVGNQENKELIVWKFL